MSVRALTLRIVPVVEEMRDADLTVTLYNNLWSQPSCPGYWDGEAWRNLDGLIFDDHAAESAKELDRAAPTHWSELPDLADATESGVLA